MGQNQRQQLLLFLLCVCGGRDSTRKRVVGRRCAMKERRWRVICYINLMSRWPNGSRKSISFSRAPGVILLTRFSRFSPYPSVGIQSLPFTVVTLHVGLLLTDPSTASSPEVWCTVKFATWWLIHSVASQERLTGRAIHVLNLQ